MRQKKPVQTFNELKQYWYAKIKEIDPDFVDIEDTNDPDSPLKVYDAIKFISLEVQAKKAKRSGYQEQIDAFANDPSFPEILKLMVKHGNSSFKPRQIECIWSMHRNALSERGIALEMKCSKSCIHFLLTRMKEWMRLTV